MANDGKYLGLDSGLPVENEAINTSAGAGDASKIIKTDSGGKLDNSFLPTGVGAETKTLASFENLAAGDWVNIFDDSGTVKARKADATTSGKEANGFVLAAVTAPANAEVYLEGTNNQLSGLTIGARHFLSTTAGAGTTTAPSTTGNTIQILGVSLSATEISFEPQLVANSIA